jgi:hypothetical protein
MEFRFRTGTFFLIVGLTLLVIFIGSVLGKDMNIIFLLISMTALLAAYQLRRNKQVNDSGRFRLIRREKDRKRLRRGEKRKKEEKESDEESYE